jgi:hypothetical protein
MEDKVKIEVDKAELEVLIFGVSEYLQMITKYIGKHRNHKDYSMDKLFAVMDAYAASGALWSKLHEAKGYSKEEIAQFLDELEAK